TYPSSASGTNASCALCHDTKSGPNVGWNAYGNLIRANIGLGDVAAFRAAESAPSVNVGGGTTNLAEINASTQPGWTTGNNNPIVNRAGSAGTAVAPASIGLLDPVAANQPPVLAPIATQSVNEGQLLQFTVTATDPDGDALTFAGGNLPTGATLADHHNGTATFSWTPSFTQAGNYPNVRSTVPTSAPVTSSAWQSSTITVGAVNQPPVLAPIPNQSVNEGQLLQYPLTFPTRRSSDLTFAGGNLPTGATLADNHNGTATFSWTPSFTQAGNYTNV